MLLPFRNSAAFVHAGGPSQRRTSCGSHAGDRSGAVCQPETRWPTCARISVACLLQGLVLALQLPSKALAGAYDPNVWCRDRNPEGRFECSWLPGRIGEASYFIPGPLEATPNFSDEDAPIAAFKSTIRKYYGSRLCSDIFVARGQFVESSARTNWTDNYWRYQSKQVVFSFSYGDCSTSPTPTSINTLLYRTRTLSCASGWSEDSAAPNIQYCYRQLPTASCTVGDPIAVGNPISLGDQNKLLTEVDFPVVSSRSLQLLRRYSVVGRYTIGNREATYHQENLGLNWEINYSYRVEPTRASATSTTWDAAAVSRGLQTSFFRIDTSSAGPRTEFRPFNRYQKDRLQVERDPSGPFVKAFYTGADNVLEEYQSGRLVRSTGSRWLLAGTVL